MPLAWKRPERPREGPEKPEPSLAQGTFGASAGARDAPASAGRDHPGASERAPERARSSRRPVLWLLGGLDPTGGAGILRDVWTARALLPRAEVGAVVSAWTWQGEGAPARAEARSLGRIAEELAALPRPDAIKVGLVPTSLIDAGLAQLLREVSAAAPIIVDPVLVATDGGELGAGPGELLGLAKIAALVTPNLGEAAALAGGVEGRDPEELLGRLVGRTGLAGPAWLLKGGHSGSADEVVDHLWERGDLRAFRRPRRGGPDPRGTGCALATAIAVGLARRAVGGGGEAPLEASVGEAIAWLDRARQRWRRGRDGQAHLPVGASAVALRDTPSSSRG